MLIQKKQPYPCVTALKECDRVLNEMSEWAFDNGLVPSIPPLLASDILDLRFQTKDIIENAHKN